MGDHISSCCTDMSRRTMLLGASGATATRYRHATVTRAQFKALAQSHSPVSLASVWADYGITG